MDCSEVVQRLRQLGRPEALEGMSRYGISTTRALGVSIPQLRKLAKELGKRPSLAAELWDTGLHEARILATMIDDPSRVTTVQMEAWVKDFDSWDLCDQCIMNLFALVPGAEHKAIDWTTRPEEYVKRAGFVIMARLASSNREAPDSLFETFLPLIEREAEDSRNYVKKGVNWALREIGTRNTHLNARAQESALRLAQSGSASARWVGRDAMRELERKAASGRLRNIG